MSNPFIDPERPETWPVYTVTATRRQTITLRVSAICIDAAMVAFENVTTLRPEYVGTRQVIGIDTETDQPILEGDVWGMDSRTNEICKLIHRNEDEDSDHEESWEETPVGEVILFALLRALELEVWRGRGLFPSNEGLGLAWLEELGEFAKELRIQGPEVRSKPLEDTKTITEGIHAMAVVARILTEGWPAIVGTNSAESSLLDRLINIGTDARNELENHAEAVAQ